MLGRESFLFEIPGIMMVHQENLEFWKIFVLEKLLVFQWLWATNLLYLFDRYFITYS